MKLSKNITIQKQDGSTIAQNSSKQIANHNQKQNKQDQVFKMQNQFTKKQSMLKRATILVDGITQNFLTQLNDGKLSIEETKKKVQQIKQIFNGSPKFQHKTIKPQQFDMQQHKKKIKKFIIQNKKLKRRIEMRSVQIMQKIKTAQLLQKKKIQQQKKKTIQLRRTQIEKRLSQRQVRLKQLKRHSITEGQDHQLSQIKRKKIFYQLKQQQYKSKVQSQKQQEQKAIINNKKQKMKPMNINDIIQHHKSYEKNKKTEKANRSLHIQRLQQKWNQYNPPNFVPKAYLLALQQEKKQKQVQEKRLRLFKINQIKKKKFLQALQQIKHAQQQFSLSKNKSPKRSEKIQEKSLQKIQIDPAEKKQKGNNYLKEVLSKAKKSKAIQNIPAYDQRLLYRKKKIKSEYELQIVRQERIQQVEKIRYRKIDEIMKSQQSQSEKIEKLKFQVQKLDNYAKQKFRLASESKEDNIENLVDRNQGASLMMTSIYAKLAILNMTQYQDKQNNRLRTVN